MYDVCTLIFSHLAHLVWGKRSPLPPRPPLGFPILLICWCLGPLFRASNDSGLRQAASQARDAGRETQLYLPGAIGGECGNELGDSLKGNHQLDDFLWVHPISHSLLSTSKLVKLPVVKSGFTVGLRNLGGGRAKEACRRPVPICILQAHLRCRPLGKGIDVSLQISKEP